MGKGDRRTRRGKIYAGSFGKTRPKATKAGVKKSAGTAAPKPAAKPAAKTARRTKAS